MFDKNKKSIFNNIFKFNKKNTNEDVEDNSSSGNKITQQHKVPIKNNSNLQSKNKSVSNLNNQIKNSTPQNSQSKFSSKFAPKNTNMSGSNNAFKKNSTVQDKIEKQDQNLDQKTLAQIRNKECLYLVKGKDKDRPAWHYVWVFPSKKRAFLDAVKSGSLDVSLYGEIKKSGWGEEPSEDIVNEIKKMYDIK